MRPNSSNREQRKRRETFQKQNKKADVQQTTNASSEGWLFFERSPIPFEETVDSATIALDVAGFSAVDFDVRFDDHVVVSIFGKRVNKLGDTS
jgi:HSP20 family molecular chaperone IbpA